MFRHQRNTRSIHLMKSLSRRTDSWLHMNYFLVCLTDGFTVVSDVSFLQFRAMNKHFRAILETLNGVKIQDLNTRKEKYNYNRLCKFQWFLCLNISCFTFLSHQLLIGSAKHEVFLCLLILIFNVKLILNQCSLCLEHNETDSKFRSIFLTLKINNLVTCYFKSHKRPFVSK